MKIAMANDQAGTALKNQIKEWLEAQGHEVVDFGTYDEEGCDLSDLTLCTRRRRRIPQEALLKKGDKMRKFSHINDSIHGLIELTNFEKYILRTAGFNRLHDVYQNSTVYYTFPSNRTKRFEHSLGTMKLASDWLLMALKNTDDNTVDLFLYIYYK